MKLHYALTISDDDTGEILFSADTYSYDRLQEELGRYERHFQQKVEQPLAEEEPLPF